MMNFNPRIQSHNGNHSRPPVRQRTSLRFFRMKTISNQQSVINTQLSGPLFIYTNDTQILQYP